jgi:hypothetical protein
MPSSVTDVFAAADLVPTGVAGWGQAPATTSAGVYVVALTDRTDAVRGTVRECPLSVGSLRQLLDVRRELRIDSDHRPTAAELGTRLAGFWLPDETVLYVGLSTRPLSERLGEFYGHRLGAKSPHKGGWPLKTLRVLDKLWVHWAPTSKDECADAENEMLRAFAAAVSPESKDGLYAPEPVMPFANLRDGHYRRKRHRVTGATGPLRSISDALDRTVEADASA